MTERERFISDLRKFASFIEAHPDLKIPYMPSFHIFTKDAFEFGEQYRAAGMSAKKNFNDWNVRLDFPREQVGVDFSIVVDREEVCQKHESEQWVEEQVVPGHYESKVTWTCPESLLEELNGKGEIQHEGRARSGATEDPVAQGQGTKHQSDL